MESKIIIKGPILIIEDDRDDQEIYATAIKSLGIANDIIFFDGAKDSLNFLLTTEEQPFIIISDVNMPGMTGLELKRIIQDDPYLCTKGIPFVFVSTNADRVAVRHAHALSVQGYFQKPSNFNEVSEMIKKIFEYWGLCKHINNT